MANVGRAYRKTVFSQFSRRFNSTQPSTAGGRRSNVTKFYPPILFYFIFFEKEKFHP